MQGTLTYLGKCFPGSRQELSAHVQLEYVTLVQVRCVHIVFETWRMA